MILDEGHFMKNFESQRYNKLMRLRVVLQFSAILVLVAAAVWRAHVH